jgi:hypothetical protein
MTRPACWSTPIFIERKAIHLMLRIGTAEQAKVPPPQVLTMSGSPWRKGSLHPDCCGNQIALVGLPGMLGILRYFAYAVLAVTLVTGAAWLASPEPPPEGYASTDGLIIR